MKSRPTIFEIFENARCSEQVFDSFWTCYCLRTRNETGSNDIFLFRNE